MDIIDLFYTVQHVKGILNYEHIHVANSKKKKTRQGIFLIDFPDIIRRA